MENNLSSAQSFNRLAHAQSTPAGVDGSGTSASKTPPATPKRTGKMIGVRVQMLDDSITIFQVQVCTFLGIFFYFTKTNDAFVVFFLRDFLATMRIGSSANFLQQMRSVKAFGDLLGGPVFLNEIPLWF